MKISKVMLGLMVTLFIAFGSAFYVGSGFADNAACQNGKDVASSSACARCGDGVCARSCENATTCPRDCGGGGGTTSTK